VCLQELHAGHEYGEWAATPFSPCELEDSDHIERVIAIGNELSKVRESLLPRFIDYLGYTIRSMHYAMVLFKHACNPRYCACCKMDVMRDLCRRVIIPLIPTMKYRPEGLQPSPRAPGLDVGPNHSLIEARTLKLFICNLRDFRCGQCLQALVYQMAKFPSMVAKDFKDVLSDSLYSTLCSLLAENFP
jgi:hypothetical protein